MEIKKGNKYLCIQDVRMDDDKLAYITGHVYISKEDGCITDEEENVDHVWEPSKCSKEDYYLNFFQLLPEELPEIPMVNNVNHPSHYADNPKGIECIDAMEAGLGKEQVQSFCLCNAFKYIFRAQKKNGIEDIKKAIWYLNKFVSLYAEQ